MKRPTPRRGRLPARRCPIRSMPAGRDPLTEERRMNPQPTEPDVREDLVARVREEIQQGTYDTPEKFQAALDRLADRLDSV